ncbi:MAG: hypothetical protein AB1439_02400 [candidate division FCPU426 bacterium]
MRKTIDTDGSTSFSLWWEAIGIVLLLTWFGVLCFRASVAYPLNFQILKNILSFSWLDKIQYGLFISHWLSTLKLVVLLAGYTLGALGNGLFIIEKLFPAERPKLEKCLLSFAVGFALLILLTFFLGVLGGYHMLIYLALYAVYVSWGLRNIYRQRHVLKTTSLSWWWGYKPVLSDRVLGVVIVLLVVLEYFAANVPECFWDSLLFHLAVPAQYIVHGGILPIPGNLFSNLPLGIEMLYTGALMLGDERLCRMLHVTLGLLTALSVFAFGRRWFGRRIGFWAAGIFITIPFVTLLSVVSGVDLGAAFFMTVAFTELIKTILAKETLPTEAWLTGLLTGASLSCKYTTGLLLAPTVLVWLVMRVYQKENLKALAFKLLIFIAGIAVCLLPWLIKNTIYNQNPLYPFLYQLFYNPNIDIGKMQAQMREFTDFGFNSWVAYLRAPWDLTFNRPSGNAYVGPLFLFLLPGLIWLGLRTRKTEPQQNVLIIIAMMAVFVWSLQTKVVRYLLPGFLPLTILYSRSLGLVEQNTAHLGKIARWCALIFMVWGVANTITYIYPNQDTVKASLGFLIRAEYLKRNMLTEYYSMAEEINRLPGKVKVYAFGESRSYYINKPITSVNSHDTNILLKWLEKSTSAEAVWEKLRSEGYTHIYVHAQEAVRTRSHETHRWTPEEIFRWQELLARYTKPIVVIQQQTLYKILDRPNLSVPVKNEKPLFVYNPEVVDVVNLLADHALRLTREGNWQEAEKEWLKIIGKAPGWNAPYVVLASMYQRQNREVEAQHMYESADQLTDLNPETYHDMGVLYWNMGKPLDAIQAMKEALRVQPGYEIAQKDLASMERAYKLQKSNEK